MLKLSQTLQKTLTCLSDTPSKLDLLGADIDQLLELPRIAIVGSRKVTPYGKAVTEKITNHLASRGVVIVSGLALGIDSIAHQTTLNVKGKTIAVLPAGLDEIYPRSHTNLAKDIIKNGGTLVSEYPHGTPPMQFRFLERNRLIAALADAVIITEAAARSGSLNTANHAINMGKPVFAVPGNITSPLSEGCNNLIKAGAIPLTKPEDIFTNLNWLVNQEALKPEANNSNEQIIFDLLNQGITEGTELLVKSGLDLTTYNNTITMLEITGRIHSLGANKWSL